MGLKDRAAQRTGGATTVISATKVDRTPKGPVAPTADAQRETLVNGRIDDSSVSSPTDYGRAGLPVDGARHLDNLSSMAVLVTDKGLNSGTYSENEADVPEKFKSKGAAQSADRTAEARAHLKYAQDLLANAKQGHDIGDFVTSMGDAHEAATHIAAAVNKLDEAHKNAGKNRSWKSYDPKDGPIDLKGIHTHLATSVNAYKKLIRSAPDKDPRIPESEADYSSASFGPSTSAPVPKKYLDKVEAASKPQAEKPVYDWNDIRDEDNPANRGWRHIEVGQVAIPHPFADPMGEMQRHWRDTARRLNPDIDKMAEPGKIPDYRGYVEENHPKEFKNVMKRINKGMGISQGMYSVPKIGKPGETPDDDTYLSNTVVKEAPTEERPSAKSAAKAASIIGAISKTTTPAKESRYDIFNAASQGGK